jgi:hypothetical protein
MILPRLDVRLLESTDVAIGTGLRFVVRDV